MNKGIKKLRGKSPLAEENDDKMYSHQRLLPIEDSPCNVFLPNVSLFPLSHLTASNEKNQTM